MPVDNRCIPKLDSTQKRERFKSEVFCSRTLPFMYQNLKNYKICSFPLHRENPRHEYFQGCFYYNPETGTKIADNVHI